MLDNVPRRAVELACLVFDQREHLPQKGKQGFQTLPCFIKRTTREGMFYAHFVFFSLPLDSLDALFTLNDLVEQP